MCATGCLGDAHCRRNEARTLRISLERIHRAAVTPSVPFVFAASILATHCVKM